MRANVYLHLFTLQGTKFLFEKKGEFPQKACPFNDLLVDCQGRFLTATKVLKYITHNAIQKYSLAAGMEHHNRTDTDMSSL